MLLESMISIQKRIQPSSVTRDDSWPAVAAWRLCSVELNSPGPVLFRFVLCDVADSLSSSLDPYGLPSFSSSPSPSVCLIPLSPIHTQAYASPLIVSLPFLLSSNMSFSLRLVASTSAAASRRTATALAASSFRSIHASASGKPCRLTDPYLGLPGDLSDRPATC